MILEKKKIILLQSLIRNNGFDSLGIFTLMIDKEATKCTFNGPYWCHTTGASLEDIFVHHFPLVNVTLHYFLKKRWLFKIITEKHIMFCSCRKIGH